MNVYPCPYCAGQALVKSGHYHCWQKYLLNRKVEEPMKITQIAGPIWKAQSESDEDKWYDIDMDVPSCKCPAMAIQPNTLRKNGRADEADAYICKHIKSIQKKTGQVVGAPTMDASEKAEVAAKKANILSQFVEREPSIQERALRSMEQEKS